MMLLLPWVIFLILVFFFFFSFLSTKVGTAFYAVYDKVFFDFLDNKSAYRMTASPEYLNLGGFLFHFFKLLLLVICLKCTLGLTTAAKLLIGLLWHFL